MKLIHLLPPALFSLLTHPAPTHAATQDTPTTNILLPLYVYPSPGAWDPVYAAIAANPTLQFQVVINPSSGPGILSSSSSSSSSNESNGSNPTSYDTNWINATATLNAFANARTFGYVHLQNGAAAVPAVEHNITAWQAWGNASAHPDFAGRNASVHGIFFDETPDDSVEYMRNLTAFAHATLDGGSSTTTSTSTEEEEGGGGGGQGPIHIIFNPGKAVLDNTYFTLAEHVIVCEIAAANYNTTAPTANVPPEYAARAAILVYDFDHAPGGATQAQLRSWLRGMVQAGIGSANVVSGAWEQSAGNATADGASADVGTVARLLAEGSAGRVGGDNGGLGVLVMAVSAVVGGLVVLL